MTHILQQRHTSSKKITPPNPFKTIYQFPKHSYMSLWGSFSLKPLHTASTLITLYFFQKENPDGKCFLTVSAPEQRWTFLPRPALHHCVQGQATQVLHHPYEGVMANGKDNIPQRLEISISENPFANSWVPRLMAAAPDESSSEYITYTFTSADKVVSKAGQ